MVGLVALLVITAACNDRTVTPPIIFEPPRGEDAGVDADGPDPVQPDSLCRGRDDGARCELENGTGLCARQQCRFLACFTGFADCDAAPGCETALESPDTCGACDVACDDGEDCQRGASGFLCSAGVVCPIDRFDLDADPENGCEVVAEWEAAATVVPGNLRIDAAQATDRGYVLAGVSDERRISTAVPPDPRPWSVVPSEMARAIDVVRDAAGTRVLWEDGLSFVDDDGVEQFLGAPCEEGVAARTFEALSGDLVATSHELLAFTDGRLRPVFGWADYLAAFWDDFEPEETVGCEPCHFDASTGAALAPFECVGTGQCRAAAFDDAVCGDCAPLGSACPDFRIVDAITDGARAYVATARGLVVLDADYTPIARAERAYDANVLGGPRFVGMAVFDAAGETQVELFHSTGMVRGLIVGDGVRPAHPDIGVPADFEAFAAAAVSERLVTLDDTNVRLLGTGEGGGRSAWLTYESAPGIQGLRPLLTLVDGEDLVVLYGAAGQIYPRRIGAE